MLTLSLHQLPDQVASTRHEVDEVKVHALDPPTIPIEEGGVIARAWRTGSLP